MNILSSLRIVQHTKTVGSILKLKDERRTWYSVRFTDLNVDAETPILSDAITIVRAFYPDAEVVDE